MKLPNLPKKKQGPKPKPDQLPDADEGSKRKPRFGFYKGAPIDLPGITGKQPASFLGSESATNPGSLSQAQAGPSHKPDIPMDIPPGPAAQTENLPARPASNPDEGVPPSSGKDDNPGRRLHAIEEAAKNAPPAKIPWIRRWRPNRDSTRRAYWDVTTTFSLIVNAILVGLLIVMSVQIRNLKTTVNAMLGGLYSNFAKMDLASINTTISVNTQIPLNFNLPLSQNTTAVLTSNVSIPNAHVVISTGGLNINSTASVTLPAGTSLPIALNVTIPVQSIIPLNLMVPVTIPLNQTGLQEPIAGLQTSLRPLYCMLNKDAQYPEGTFICAEHTVPTPVTP